MTTSRLDAEAKKNQKAHRAAEAAALALLFRARDNAVESHDDAAVIAAAMRPRFRDAVVIARHNARSEALDRLAAEAKALDVRISASAANEEYARDWIRANRVSESYTKRWLEKATELGDIRAASSSTIGSVERIAVTESSEAFTSSRTKAVERETNLMRVWDASLDKRTCNVCSNADGTVVRADESFPAGEPGSVHSNCRCGWTLSTVSFHGPRNK